MSSTANQYVSQMGSIRRPFAMWLFISAFTLMIVGVIVAAPLTLAGGHDGIARTIYQAFSHVCHQIPERSFFLDGHPFAVCARCTGIYAGFASATLLYPLLKSLRQTETPARKWLFVATAPLGIDWAVEFFGIWHNTHTSRFVTGALLGATAVFYVIPGLVDLSLREWGSRNPNLKPPISLASSAFPANNARSDYSAPERRI